MAMTTTAPHRYVPTTEVAKLVRAYLKREFPGVKFSVRSDKYAGGSAVDVTVPHTWTHEQQHELWNTLSPWGSSGFDGMTDSTYAKGHTLCPEHGVCLTYVGSHFGTQERVEEPCCEKAESVNLGASYVQVHRDWRDS